MPPELKATLDQSKTIQAVADMHGELAALNAEISGKLDRIIAGIEAPRPKPRPPLTWVLLGLILAVLIVLAVREPAKAQVVPGTQGYCTTIPSGPGPNGLITLTCNSSGQLLTTASSSTTFPYTFTANQTATAASFLGIGGYDGAHFQPLATQTNGSLNVDCVTGCAALSLPYTFTAAQTATASSFLGIGGYDGAHYQPVNVNTSGQLQVVFPSAQAVTQSAGPWTISGTVQPGNTQNTTPWLTTDSAKTLLRLNSSSATACTSISTTATQLVTIINAGAATTVFPIIYDEGGSPTCAASDTIYGDGATIVLGAGQILTFKLHLSNGLAYKLSGSLTGSVPILINGY